MSALAARAAATARARVGRAKAVANPRLATMRDGGDAGGDASDERAYARAQSLAQARIEE
jgi:hypothetical protein